MSFRPAILALLCWLISAAVTLAEDEWEPYRRTGLFPEGGERWLAPNMKKETVEDFTARLLDGSRRGEPRAMATLGRFFYVRGDRDRGAEWLRKAAQAGHTAAQLDYGQLRSGGTGAELAEAYQWLWLATWAHEPGAEESLRKLEPKLQMWHVVAGVRWAAEFQAVQANQAPAPSPSAPAR